jgi:hypothetical protein
MANITATADMRIVLFISDLLKTSQFRRPDEPAFLLVSAGRSQIGSQNAQ